MNHLAKKPNNRRLRRSCRRLRGCRSGNAIIETAIAFNVLLWLSMGMVEFGEFFYIRHAFEAAARDGCRAAVMASASQSGVNAIISSTLSQANVTFNTSWLSMTETDPVSGATSTVTDVSVVPYGDALTMTISTTYGSLPQSTSIRPLSAITGKGISSSKVISGQATFVKE